MHLHVCNDCWSRFRAITLMFTTSLYVPWSYQTPSADCPNPSKTYDVALDKLVDGLYVAEGPEVQQIDLLLFGKKADSPPGRNYSWPYPLCTQSRGLHRMAGHHHGTTSTPKTLLVVQRRGGTIKWSNLQGTTGYHSNHISKWKFRSTAHRQYGNLKKQTPCQRIILLAKHQSPHWWSCQSCHLCQENQPKQQKEPLEPHAIPPTPWPKLGTDLFKIQSFLLIKALHDNQWSRSKYYLADNQHAWSTTWDYFW